MVSEYLKDTNGKPSSKRKWAGMLIAAGIIIGTITASLGFYYPIKDETLILRVVEIFVFSGCGLLGFGTFAEKFKGKT